MPQLAFGSQALFGAALPTNTGIVVRLVGGNATVFNDETFVFVT
jgi:hypothetical protein